VAGLRLSQSLMEVQHPLDEAHHLIVAGDVGGVGEVDGAGAGGPILWSGRSIPDFLDHDKLYLECTRIN